MRLSTRKWQIVFFLNSFVLMTSLVMTGFAQGQEMTELPTLGDRLSADQVDAFAKLALHGMHTEYPNKPSNILAGVESVQTPSEMHPAFYGCFDWHSSVHGHWMLIRLLREYPNGNMDKEIREKLAISLTAEKIKKETEYFELKHNKNFERMYGWAWLLRMVIELDGWDDPQGKQWRENLRPLESIIVKRTMDYLPLLQFPIRTGVHPDSGFALGQVLDYARQVKNTELEQLIVSRAKYYYQNDVNYPTRYEPSGQDFFSSCWNEADLMRRVLPQDEFVAWFDAYLPTLAASQSGRLLIPVEVSDVKDGQIVHLAGLDLSRGWCLQGIASSLKKGDPRREILTKSAAEHAKMGFKYVFSGHYEGEHWLATFAVYLITDVGVVENAR